MNGFFIVDDGESKYHGQIATLVHRTTIGTGLAIYLCSMDDGENIRFLSYQLLGGFLTRSEANEANKSH